MKLPSKYKCRPNPRVYSKCVECGAEGMWFFHHFIFGSNKKLADYFKLWGAMCDRCHNKLHRHNPELAEKYKRKGQEIFEEQHPELNFLEIFQRNYRF